MKILVLYPGDYFDPTRVDADYRDELEALHHFPEFAAHRFGYDEFVAEGRLRFSPEFEAGGLCIYRGWMLKPSQYQILYEALAQRGVQLINSPAQYAHCHLFPNAYPSIQGDTPRALWFPAAERIDWEQVNGAFARFMLKDYVKSVKGSDFPAFFQTPVDAGRMQPVLERFTELRGGLFTGGFLFKEYIDLRRYGPLTNEYRAFFLDGELLTLSRNSNQPGTCLEPPMPYVEQFTGLGSRFYTVDFAEKSAGEWVVIETGDGQVSGLSPGQYLFKFYDELRGLLCGAAPGNSQ